MALCVQGWLQELPVEPQLSGVFTFHGLCVVGKGIAGLTSDSCEMETCLTRHERSELQSLQAIQTMTCVTTEARGLFRGFCCFCFVLVAFFNNTI